MLDLASQQVAGAEASLLDAAKRGAGMWARFAEVGQVTRVDAQDGRLSLVLNGQNGIMELDWRDQVRAWGVRWLQWTTCRCEHARRCTAR